MSAVQEDRAISCRRRPCRFWSIGHRARDSATSMRGVPMGTRVRRTDRAPCKRTTDNERSTRNHAALLAALAVRSGGVASINRATSFRNWGLHRRRIHPTPDTTRCVMNLPANYAHFAASSSVKNRAIGDRSSRSGSARSGPGDPRVRGPRAPSAGPRPRPARCRSRSTMMFRPARPARRPPACWC